MKRHRWWCPACERWLQPHEVDGTRVLTRHSPRLAGCNQLVQWKPYETNGDGKPVDDDDLYVVCRAGVNGHVVEFIELETADGKGVGPDTTGATWHKWRSGLSALGPFRSAALKPRTFDEHKDAMRWAAKTLWNHVNETPPLFGDYMVWWAGGEWRATWVPVNDMPMVRTDGSWARGCWVLRDRKVGFLWWKKPLRIKPSHWRTVDGLKPIGGA